MAASRLIIAPHILLPRAGIDMRKFAVVACDQFTSQPGYWDELERFVGPAPSTLRMIFPEAYLPRVEHTKFITGINDTINRYLHEGILEDAGACFVLIERSTPYAKRRLGLMIAFDLEQYSYAIGAKTPIRASEATIVERIPPRLKIREHAPIELPHVQVLFDDPKHEIIRILYEKRQQFPLLYDFELNQGGGHLRGYRIDDTDAVIASFMRLLRGRDLLFVIGDGNHSLATAKAHWDKIKAGLREPERVDHPARFSLVEAINIYDEGLKFEPIHRLVLHAGGDFLPGLKDKLSGTFESLYFTKHAGRMPLMMPANSPHAYEVVQTYIDDYRQQHPQVEVDYIHGLEDLLEIAGHHDDAVAIAMPALTKSDIFTYLELGAVLPRKSFSMGHALEKRYYLESKTIIINKGE